MSVASKNQQIPNSDKRNRPLKKIERKSTDEFEIMRDIVEASPEIRLKVMMRLKEVQTRLEKKR